MEKKEILEGILEDAKRYKAYNGKICYRTMSPLDYYFLKCRQLSLIPKCINSLSYEAQNNEIELNWCEEDLIIYFKKPLYFIKSFYSDWQQKEAKDAKKFINDFINRTPTKQGKQHIKSNFIKIFGSYNKKEI